MVTKRMNLEDLERIDSRNMFRVYDIWPEIAKKSFENKYEELDFKNIDHIIFTGMGGSGTIGDVTTNIPIPAGVTIYGKFNSIELDSGTVIAYAEHGAVITGDAS